MPYALKGGEEISRLETTCICKGESVPPVGKESTQEISVPKDSLVEELPDSLLSVEKQPTETKERRDEQLCYQDSLIEEPPDSFVSDNVPVVPRDGITPSSEDSLGKEPRDTVVSVVQSCVVPPRVSDTPSLGIQSDVSQHVVPPQVGVTTSRRIPSDVLQRQRKTIDDWDPGPRVQRAIPVPGACLFVCGISLTSGQLFSELFPDCTRSCFSQVVLRRKGGDRIYGMRCPFVAVGPNARFIVLPHSVSHWDNMS